MFVQREVGCSVSGHRLTDPEQSIRRLFATSRNRERDVPVGEPSRAVCRAAIVCCRLGPRRAQGCALGRTFAEGRWSNGVDIVRSTGAWPSSSSGRADGEWDQFGRSGCPESTRHVYHGAAVRTTLASVLAKGPSCPPM